MVSYVYDVFGRVMDETEDPSLPADWSMPYRFSTKRYYPEFGMSDFGFRFYSAELGRWINRDPLGIEGGLNLYAFVGNSPVSYVDPFGLRTVGIGVGAIAGFGVAASDSGLIVLDGHGNFAVITNGGGGGMALLSASGGLVVQATNADSVHELEGPSVQVGGSVGEILGVGFDKVLSENYEGYNFNAGFTMKLPLLAEGHATLEYGVIRDEFNIFEVIEMNNERAGMYMDDALDYLLVQ